MVQECTRIVGNQIADVMWGGAMGFVVGLAILLTLGAITAFYGKHKEDQYEEWY